MYYKWHGVAAVAATVGALALGMWLGEPTIRRGADGWCVHATHAMVCSLDMKDLRLVSEDRLEELESLEFKAAAQSGNEWDPRRYRVPNTTGRR